MWNKELFADAKSQQLRKFVLSIIRPCNPSFNDVFVLAHFLILMLVRSGLPIIPELAYSYTVFLASVPSVSVRFRAKRDDERERGVQIVGTGACFKKRTRGKRGEISSRFFFLVIFSPALLDSWLCIILDSTEAPSEK